MGPQSYPFSGPNRKTFGHKKGDGNRESGLNHNCVKILFTCYSHFVEKKGGH